VRQWRLEPGRNGWDAASDFNTDADADLNAFALGWLHDL